jgi:hypothetical protein
MENTSTGVYVRRYDYDWDDETNLYTMCERVDGPYVSHDDYDALRAERDAAVSMLNQWKDKYLAEAAHHDKSRRAWGAQEFGALLSELDTLRATVAAWTQTTPHAGGTDA